MEPVCKKPDNVRLIVNRALKINPDATVDEMHASIIEEYPNLVDNKIYMKGYVHYYNLHNKIEFRALTGTELLCKKPANVKAIVDRALDMDPEATEKEMHASIIAEFPLLSTNEIYLKWYVKYYNMHNYKEGKTLIMCESNQERAG